MKSKRCGKCQTDKPVAEFSKSNSKKDGLQAVCKECDKTYYEANKEARKEAMKAYDKATDHSPSKSKAAFKKLLEAGEKPEYDSEGFITVECKYSAPGNEKDSVPVHRFRPTKLAIHGRTSARKSAKRTGRSVGNSYLYCSDKCKDACLIYGTGADGESKDPTKILKFIMIIAKQEDPNTAAEARACQKSVKDALLENQIDNHGYTFCEICGDRQDSGLHDHHTLPVAIHGRDSINAAAHMIVCQRCHIKTHSVCKV